MTRAVTVALPPFPCPDMNDAAGDPVTSDVTDRPTACLVRLVNQTCPEDCRCPFLALRSLLRLLQGA